MIQVNAIVMFRNRNIRLIQAQAPSIHSVTASAAATLKVSPNSTATTSIVNLFTSSRHMLDQPPYGLSRSRLETNQNTGLEIGLELNLALDRVEDHPLRAVRRESVDDTLLRRCHHTTDHNSSSQILELVEG